MEPKGSYRQWLYIEGFGGKVDLVVVEPDGVRMNMRKDMDREEAQKLCKERTDVERLAQLEREKQ